MGLETFNEPLLASYESVSDKTQKGGKESKKEDKNLHHPYFINSFGVQELDDKSIGNECLFPHQHLIIKTNEKVQDCKYNRYS